MENIKLVIDQLIDNLKDNAFKKDWSKNISNLLNVDNLRINSLIIGSVDFCPLMLFVGANTNKILIFNLDGNLLQTSIELKKGVEVKRLFISDTLSDEGDELIILTNDDTLYFYGFSKQNDSFYEHRGIQFHHPLADITACISFKNNNDKGLVIGDSKGDIFLKRPDDVARNPHLDKSYIPALQAEELIHLSLNVDEETQSWELVIAYKDGHVYLLDQDGEVISQVNLERDISNLYSLGSQGKFIATAEYPYIACISLTKDNSKLDWEYDLVFPITDIIPVNDVNRHGFLTISEDSEQIIHFSLEGNILYYADPAFPGNTGIKHDNYIYLASNEGEICKFEMPKENEIINTINNIYDKYEKYSNSEDFTDFFTEQFNDEDNLKFFREFLIKKLSNHAVDRVFFEKVENIFLKKKYDTRIEEGLLSKICSSSLLKDCFLEAFKDKSPFHAIKHYEKQKAKGVIAFDSEVTARKALKDEPLKSLSLLESLRLSKLDFTWKYDFPENDDIISVSMYPDPFDEKLFQVLVITKNGSLILFDKNKGLPIWTIDLQSQLQSDFNIVNMDVSDVFGSNDLEIILGLENARNEIFIISTKSDLHAQCQKLSMRWFENETTHNDYLYLISVTISGVKKHNTHRVKCYDFDDDGKKDLVIFSEGFYSIGIFKDDQGQFETKYNHYNEVVMAFDFFAEVDGKKMLLKGNDQGEIFLLPYQDGSFMDKSVSFKAADTITDIKTRKTGSSGYDILVSSADNHIYCLSKNLEYKWSFKTRGDVDSIFINEDSQTIFITSIDGYLYSLDFYGSNMWDFYFGLPLANVITFKNHLFVSDERTLYSAILINNTEIENTINSIINESKIDILELLNSENRYLRILAARTILSKNEISTEETSQIINLLSDQNEFEDIVREETYKNISNYIYKADNYMDEFFDILVDGMKDHSPDVQISALHSCFDLLEGFHHKESELKKQLIYLAEDDNLWVKDAIAAELSNLKLDSEARVHLVWDVLIALVKANLDEEWILRETSESIAKVLNRKMDNELRIHFYNSLFALKLDSEILTTVKSRIVNPISKIIYDVYYGLQFYEKDEINRILTQVVDFCEQGEFVKDSEPSNFYQFYSIIKDTIAIIVIDDLDTLLLNIDKLSSYIESLENNSNEITYFIDQLKNYHQVQKISEKVNILNRIVNSNIENLDEIIKSKGYRYRLLKFVLQHHMLPIISTKIKDLYNSIHIFLEDIDENIYTDTDGIANISFQILNGSLNPLKSVNINILENDLFDIVSDSTITMSDLYPDQKSPHSVKIKPLNPGKIIVNLLINVENHPAQVKKLTFNICERKELLDYIDNPDLKNRSQQLIQYARETLEELFNLSGFTWMINHGLKHIENVNSYAFQLLRMYPEVLESLNDSELYVLIHGIWLHDTGMSNLKKEEDMLRRRKFHGKLSAMTIKEETNINSRVFREYIQAIGQLCVYHQSKAPIDEEHIKEIGERALYNKPIKESITINFCNHTETVRLRLLAAILSLADAIDIGEHRIAGLDIIRAKKEYIKYMNQAYNAKIDLEQSELHFQKHKAINNVVFGKKEILLEDAYSGIIEEEKVWALEGKKQITEELERCERVLAKNGINDLKIKIDWENLD